jgi:hypothetical protein
MERAGDQRFGVKRLRWRLRGAWQWPSFAVAIVADALLLHLLPIAGDGTGLAPATLLALLFNLLAVAVLAPPLGALLRRRRRDLPTIVARDYAGTALVAALALLIAVLGVVHQPAVRGHERTVRALGDAVRSFAAAHAPARFRVGIDRADVLQIDASLYRACAPAITGGGWWCVVVDASKRPMRVRFDPSGAANSTVGHPLG